MRAVLLDLGGVLVELAPSRDFLERLGGAQPAEALWRRWLASPSVRAHETGQMATSDWAAAVVREFNSPLSPADFLQSFHDWIVGPFDGAHALLDQLRARHRTAILTNLSAVHWEAARNFGLFERVDSVFASFREGVIKPDREFFGLALERLNVGASNAVFLDDNLTNVEGARACGIEAHVVRGIAETRATLAGLGLLDK